MEPMVSPGFYGKLPVLGDFVSRRIDRDFINGWDEWLQSAIACSKEALGEQWLESYLTSPIWRFVLSPGVCGSRARVGVMMPSVDRVGRYFPFTIVLSFDDIESVPLLSQQCDCWFENVESIALAALEEDLSVNQIDEMLNGVNNDCWRNQAFIRMQESDEIGQGIGKKAFLLQTRRSENVGNEHLLGLSHCLINECFSGYTLWQTGGSAMIDSSLLLCQGLPPVNAYTGLLTGQMPERGWHLQSTIVQTEAVSWQTQQNQDQDCLLDLNPTKNEANPLWRSYSAIHCGKRRQLNEDALLDRSDKGLWVVADGMGGHQAGDVASQMIVDAMDQEIFPGAELHQSIEQVKACLYGVNRRLRQLATERYGNQIVGSTVVALVGSAVGFACVWAGDSRLYRLRNRQLQQMTVDHCEGEQEANALLDLSLQDVKSNNVITRAVGAFEALELDCVEFDAQIGDKLLLCSDGLDKELSPVEIERILNDNHQDYANALMQAALTKEARDNISIIVIEIS